MTAVIGGSTKFVAGAFLPLEVQNMYSIRVEMDPRLRTNRALREYARLEYGAEDALWFLAAVRRSKPKPFRPRIPFRLGSRARTHAPVACKGTPRGVRSESPSPI